MVRCAATQFGDAVLSAVTTMIAIAVLQAEVDRL